MTVQTKDMLTLYENYLGRQKEIKALREQINEIKEIGPLKATKLSDMPKGSGGISSSIENYFLKIEKLEKIYRDLIDRHIEDLDVVEKHLESVDDCQLKAILRYHYILGYSWIDTSIEVYGLASYQQARRVAMRYFGKEK